MNLSRLILPLILLSVSNSTLPIIIHASQWSKTGEDGTTQNVYLFGDRHLWLKVEPAIMHERIKQLTHQEQTAIIDWAKNLEAFVIAEDLTDYSVSGKLAKLKKHLHSWFINKKCATTYLANLVATCRTHNIACLNIENRHEIYLASFMAEYLNEVPETMLEIYFCAYLYDKFVSPCEFYQSLKTYRASLFSVLYAPLLLCLEPLYKAHQHYKESAAKITKHATLPDIAERINNEYKNTPLLWLVSPIVRFTGWQIDVNIMDAILQTPKEKTIFVCAGDLHVRKVAQFLKEQGYTQQSFEEDRIATVTGYRNVDIEKPLDIELFMKNASLQCAPL